MLSFEDPKEQRSWIFDATFMRSSWKCIFGEGCQGILDKPTPELNQGCCSEGDGISIKSLSPSEGLVDGCGRHGRVPEQFFLNGAFVGIQNGFSGTRRILGRGSDRAASDHGGDALAVDPKRPGDGSHGLEVPKVQSKYFGLKVWRQHGGGSSSRPQTMQQGFGIGLGTLKNASKLLMGGRCAAKCCRPEP
jgi:hypothetical protein